MSVQTWMSKALSSKKYQKPEAQHLIDTFQRFLSNESTSSEAADSIATILEPLIRKDPSDLCIGLVWHVLCDVVRDLGSDLEISKRLVDLVESLRQIRVKDENGNIMKNGPSEYWTDIPRLALTFREYGIDIEPDEDLEPSEWLAQKPTYLSATTFAAMALARSETMIGMSFYVPSCMREALDGPYDTPEPHYRAAMYVPAAYIWISIAGPKIYGLCSRNAKGLGLDSWEQWKKGFGDVSVDSQVEDEVREIALRAQNEMRLIQDQPNM